MGVLDVILRSPQRERVLFALLAGTGLRIGEALALKHSDFSDGFRVLRVNRSLWKGKEQSPKTENAVREVDLHPWLAAVFNCQRETAVTAQRATQPSHHHTGWSGL